MNKLENFLDEYLEIAKEGAEVTLQGARDIGWLIFRLLLVVLLFPFWLAGKRERRLTMRAADFATPWPELNTALQKFSDLMKEINKPQSR